MATARIELDKRKSKQDNTYPVKIRIAHIKEFKRLGTTISLTEDDFNKMMAGKHLNQTLKDHKSKLDALIFKANEIIESLQVFNFDTFKLRFTQRGNRTDLIFLLKEKANEFYNDESYNSSNLYKQTASFLLAFINRNRPDSASPISELPITQFTPKWITELEKWSLKVTRKQKVKGSKDQYEEKLKYSSTTLGTYLMRVRTIFNDLISLRELNPNLYPFHKADNKSGYKIPKGKNNKRALTIDKIMKLYKYEAATTREQFAKDFFIFSYLSSGINPADVFKLKWSDIDGEDKFTFVRKKTAKKTGGTNEITIFLNEYLWDIIKRHGSHKVDSDYIFNVFPAGATEKNIIDKTKSAISSINTTLKKILQKLGITDNISTYFARHSFSTIQMINDTPLPYISKQLGHQEIKTTQNYLGSFPTEKAIEYQNNLLDFSIEDEQE